MVKYMKCLNKNPSFRVLFPTIFSWSSEIHDEINLHFLIRIVKYNLTQACCASDHKKSCKSNLPFASHLTFFLYNTTAT